MTLKNELYMEETMAIEYYSAAPFVTLDGKDSDGIRAEVKVVTGFAKVGRINDSDSGKAASIAFPVDNTKYASSGWVKKDSEVYRMVEKAKEDDTPLYFRVESVRKKDVDRSLPMSEIAPPKDTEKARENIFKSLAAVKVNEDDEWTFNPDAATNPIEDPNRNNSRPSALSMSSEELAGSKPAPKSYGSNSSKFDEPAPFFTHRSDGGLNYGSYETGIALNFYMFVSGHLRDNGIREDFSDKEIKLASKVLLKIANRIQMSFYDGEMEKPELNLNSHTKARSLVFETVRSSTPLTKEKLEKENLSVWSKDVYKKARELWQWNLDEVSEYIETE